jgi:uncharacterized damage-inducible protein DinB
MLHVSLNDLLDYTEWQRAQWHAVLQQQGPEVLTVSAGPHGDGRFEAVGDLIRHIFSAEMRYVERLAGRALTDTSTLASDNLDGLFTFGRESRQELRRFVDTFPPEQWDVLQEFTLMNSRLQATPRKILIHVVMHEIRHWAQIATLLRLRGTTAEFQDFLFSPVLGGDFKRGQNSR